MTGSVLVLAKICGYSMLLGMPELVPNWLSWCGKYLDPSLLLTALFIEAIPLVSILESLEWSWQAVLASQADWQQICWLRLTFLVNLFCCLTVSFVLEDDYPIFVVSDL